MSDVVVLIDREQGGEAHLQKHNLKLHAAFTLSFIVDTLLAHKLAQRGGGRRREAVSSRRIKPRRRLRVWHCLPSHLVPKVAIKHINVCKWRPFVLKNSSAAECNATMLPVMGSIVF